MDFEQLLRQLVTNRVRFIVAGGVACALNGFVRATEDLDILVEQSEDNLRKMLETLLQWGEGHAKELRIEDFSLSPGAVRIIEDFPLDIFTVLKEKTYHDLLPYTLMTETGIPYLDPTSLIETKKDTQLERDKIDILALERILSEQDSD